MKGLSFKTLIFVFFSITFFASVTFATDNNIPIVTAQQQNKTIIESLKNKDYSPAGCMACHQSEAAVSHQNLKKRFNG